MIGKGYEYMVKRFLLVICFLFGTVGIMFIFQKLVGFEETEENYISKQDEIESLNNIPMELEDIEDPVQIIIDESVSLNDAFIPFVEGEVKAYSYRNDEEKYLSEYYDEHSVHEIDIIRFMAEDLNGDGKDELLINMHWKYNEGIILVFYVRDGNYFEWEPILYGMHSPKVYFYPDIQVVEITGTGWTRSFFVYNSQGEQERIFSCSSVGDDLENGNFRRQYLIIKYQNGIEVEEYSISEIFDENNNGVLENNKEDEIIFDKVLNDFLDVLGDGKQINSIQSVID